MVKVVWILFSLLAALWTALAWLTGRLIGWAAEAASTGSASVAIEAAAAWELPAWAALWIDPALWRALQSLAMASMEWIQAALPHAGTAGGWVVAAVWIGWGLGMVVLLAVAGVSHLLVRHAPGRPTVRAA